MNKKEFIETLIDIGGCGAEAETWDRGWDDAIGEVIGIAEELDEPETLSQEWIDENKVARIDNLRKMTTSDVVTVEKLKNLIVPKQDKPVIPRFVADYIELNKGWSEDRQEYIEDDSNGLWFALDDNSYGMPNSVSDWLFNEEKVETFAKAWLDGYEVEKEKKYTVSSPKEASGFWFLSKSNDGEVVVGTNKDYFDYDWDALKLTEQEIKDYDERYWAFAQEVTPCN